MIAGTVTRSIGVVRGVTQKPWTRTIVSGVELMPSRRSCDVHQRGPDSGRV